MNDSVCAAPVLHASSYGVTVSVYPVGSRSNLCQNIEYGELALSYVIPSISKRTKSRPDVASLALAAKSIPPMITVPPSGFVKSSLPKRYIFPLVGEVILAVGAVASSLKLTVCGSSSFPTPSTL